MKKLLSLRKWLVISVIISCFFSSPALLGMINNQYVDENNNGVYIDLRPTDFEYALMSEYAYRDYQDGGKGYEDRALDDFDGDYSSSNLYEELVTDQNCIINNDSEVFEIKIGSEKEQKFFELLENWRILRIVKEGKSGYQGVIFVNDETEQVVIAHRGTVLSEFKTIKEDLTSVVKGRHSSQMKEIFYLIKKVIDYAKERNYNLSFTGHSLGGFLAEISVYFCHRNNNHYYPQASAVTFDSPGSKEILEKLQPHITEHGITLEELDIKGYVTNPNVINTFNHRIGSTYLIELDLDNYNPETWNPTEYTRKVHSLSNIIRHFEKNYYVESSKNSELFAKYVYNWPISNLSELSKSQNIIEKSINMFQEGFDIIIGKSSIGDVALPLISGVYSIYSDIVSLSNINKQKSIYYEHAKFDKDHNCYRIPIDTENFDLIYKAGYETREYDSKFSMLLKHFNNSMQIFLKQLYEFNSEYQDLIEEIKEKVGIEEKCAEYLKSFRIGDDKAEGKKPVDIVLLDNDSPFDIHEFRSELSRCLSTHQEAFKIHFPMLVEEVDITTYKVSEEETEQRVEELHVFFKERFKKFTQQQEITEENLIVHGQIIAELREEIDKGRIGAKDVDELVLSSDNDVAIFVPISTPNTYVDDTINAIVKITTKEELDGICKKEREEGGLDVIQLLLESQEARKTLGEDTTSFWKKYLKANFSDDNLQELSKIKYLITLDLSGYKLITDNGLRHITKLVYLKSLNLSGCTKITSKGLKTLFSRLTDNKQKANLEGILELDLSGCDAVTNDVLEIIRDKLTNLKLLNLSNCTNINDDSLDHLSYLGIEKLEHLSLQNCNEITEEGWLTYIANFEHIVSLNISGCDGVTDTVLKKIANKLIELKSLSLADNDKITDVGIDHIMNLEELELLDLSDCNNVSYLTIQQLRSQGLEVNIKGKLKKIEELYEIIEKDPTQLTDEEINQLSLTLTDADIMRKMTKKDLLFLVEKAKEEERYCFIQILMENNFVKDKIKFAKLYQWRGYLKPLFSDEDLQLLSKLASYLTTLDLSGYSLITDKGLKYLIKLNKLNSLNLSACIKITDVGLKQHVAKLNNLISLDITYCNSITYSGTGQLPQSTLTITMDEELTKIKQLFDTIKTDMLQKTVDEKRQFFSILKEKSVMKKITREDLLSLYEKAKKEKQHYLIQLLIEDDVTKKIVGKHDISRWQDYLKQKFDDNDLQEISAIINLTTLNLNGYNSITDKGFTYIENLNNLTSLNLSETNITDDGLKHINNLNKLKLLDLSWCNNLNGDGLKYIESLTNLTLLNLSGCYINNEALAHIEKLSKLVSLNLSWGNKINDDGLAHLTSLKTHLTSLNLAYCNRITDVGVEKHITKLTSLESLNLSGCDITDRGVDSFEKSGLKSSKVLKITF